MSMDYLAAGYGYPRIEDCDLMEVDNVDELAMAKQSQVPHLPLFNLSLPSSPPPHSKQQQQSHPTAICFFKQEPVDHQHQQQQPAQPRRQQTNVPDRPLNEFIPEHQVDSNGACPPGIEGFDDLPEGEPPSPNLPTLSVDEVDKELECLGGIGPLPGSSTSYCDPAAPCVPEVLDQPASPLEPVQSMFLVLPQSTDHLRKRRPTISLMPEQQLDSPSSHDCLFGDDGRDIMHELMDKVDDDMSTGQCDHIPMPSVCNATSADHRQYDDSARCILQMHQVLGQDMPHAKKKPMLHEFLGYVLFSRDPELSILHGSIYFCRDSGDRLEPQRLNSFFRVAKFPAVSEVWKRIKCNSSKDCTKNMKRAMRMSTSNERRYFVNLTQRMHRMQIFRFGERSLEFFRRVFPIGVDGQWRCC